jgi:hypothetical protein
MLLKSGGNHIRLSLIFLAFVVSFVCAGQTWEMHFDFLEKYNAGYAIAKTNYGYITVSNKRDSEYYKYDLVITGVDFDGNVLFQKNYEHDSSHFSNINRHNMIQAADDNYFVVLNTTLPVSNGYRSYPILLKFTPQGDTLWSKMYNLTPAGDYVFMGLKQADNGELYMYGGRVNVSVNQLSRGFAMRTDEDGNYLWHSDYDDFYYTMFKDIVIDGDGFFAVGANQHDVTMSDQYSQYIIRVNSSDELEWTKWIESEDEPARDLDAEAGILLDNGNLLICASRTDTTLWTGINRPMVAEVDKQTGEVVWMRVFEEYIDQGWFYQIRRLESGDFIATGETGADITSYNGPDHVPFVMRFTQQGEVIWCRVIIPADLGSDEFWFGYGSIEDFVINDDNGITSIGSLNTYTETGPQNGWIQDSYMLRIDDLGCLVPGCDTLASVAENNYTKMAMNLYPNPSGDLVNIHFENASTHQVCHFEITNSQGQSIRNWTTKLGSVSYQFIVSDLPSGNYLIRIVNENGQYVSKKFEVIK